MTVPQNSPSGRFLPFSQTTGGYVQADTLAQLDALPAFEATLAYLAGLISAGDKVGGLFEVTAGLTADGFNVIDLTGVHSGKQLRRIDNTPNNLSWANTSSAATTLVQNVPKLTAASFGGFGCGPFSRTGATEFTWLGEDNALFLVSYTLNLTGTALDRIFAELVNTDSVPAALSGLIGGEVGSAGKLIVAGSFISSLNRGDKRGLAYENKVSNNSVTTVSAIITLTRVWGNQNTFYL